MRILDYLTPRSLARAEGTTPVGLVLTRLALFLGVTVAVWVFIWCLVVFFVTRLIRIPF
jgi:hypothetical protein